MMVSRLNQITCVDANTISISMPAAQNRRLIHTDFGTGCSFNAGENSQLTGRFKPETDTAALATKAGCLTALPDRAIKAGPIPESMLLPACAVTSCSRIPLVTPNLPGPGSGVPGIALVVAGVCPGACSGLTSGMMNSGSGKGCWLLLTGVSGFDLIRGLSRKRSSALNCAPQNPHLTRPLAAAICVAY